MTPRWPGTCPFRLIRLTMLAAAAGGTMGGTAAAQGQPPAALARRAEIAVATDLRLGQIAAERGDPRAALAAYERVLKRDPNNAAALAAMIDAATSEAVSATDPAAALQGREFRQLAERAAKHAADADQLTRFAGLALKRGDVTQALRAYERAFAMDPDNRTARDGMVAASLAAVVPRAGRDDGEFQQIFDRILRDPGNVELNLRYARLAIERGEPRKALPAYERILAAHPDNAEARAGLARVRRDLDPTITQVSAAFGAQYESNPRHFRNQTWRTGAATLAGRIGIYDERRIADVRWRSDGDVYYVWHSKFHEIDYGSIGGRTGPVFDLDEGVRLHVFAGASYAWLKGRSFYGEASTGATLEFDDLGPLRSVTARFGYDNVGKHISSRDALFVEVAPRFLFANLGYAGATGWVGPYWRYNGVLGSGAPGLDQRTELFPSRSHQLGIRADYFMPIVSELTIGLSLAYEYRHFYESVIGDTRNRRDHLVSPGIQAIISGFGDERLGIVVNYGFEHRFSNDGFQIYSNHAAGVRFVWKE